MYYLIKTYNLIDYYKFNEKNIPKNKIYFGNNAQEAKGVKSNYFNEDLEFITWTIRISFKVFI